MTKAVLNIKDEKVKYKDKKNNFFFLKSLNETM